MAKVNKKSISIFMALCIFMAMIMPIALTAIDAPSVSAKDTNTYGDLETEGIVNPIPMRIEEESVISPLTTVKATDRADMITDWDNPESIVYNNDSGFPDPFVYAKVLDTGDTNNNGVLTVDEAMSIEYIQLYNPGYVIESIKGIGRLKNLVKLELFSANLPNFKEFESLTMLNHLQIYNCAISDENLNTATASLSQLSNLNRFEWSYMRKLPNLSLMSNTTITELVYNDYNIDNDDFKEIVETFPNLSMLQLMTGSVLTDIDGIEKLQSLNVLSLYNGNTIHEPNEVRSLDKISLLPDITSLDLMNIKIDSLAIFSGLSKLYNLTVWSSGLTSLDGIENFPKLTKFNAQNCNITSLEGIDFPNGLFSLYLANNQLTSLKGIESAENLNSISVAYNNVSDISDVKHLTSLKSFGAQGNKLTNLDGIQNLKNLESVYLMDNSLTDATGLENLTKLKVLHLERNAALSKLPSLKSLTKLSHDSSNKLDVYNVRTKDCNLTAKELWTKLPDHFVTFPDNIQWFNWVKDNSCDGKEYPNDDEPTSSDSSSSDTSSSDSSSGEPSSSEPSSSEPSSSDSSSSEPSSSEPTDPDTDVTDWDDENSIVYNNDSGIPDSALHRILLNIGDKLLGGNNDGMLTVGETRRISALDLSKHSDSQKINSLKGLTNLKNLQALMLSELDVDISDISNMSQLTILELNNMTFADSDKMLDALSTLVNLDILSFNKVEVPSFNKLAILNLSSLSCTNTNLDNDDFQDIVKLYPTLKLLNLSNNPLITDVSGIDKLENLEEFLFGSKSTARSYAQILNLNQISSLDNLKSLSLYGINGISIPAYNTIATLEKICINYSDITDIKGIETMSKLKVLDLKNNKLTNIDGINILEALEVLALDNNNLTNIDLTSKLINIYSLSVSNNQITSLPYLDELTKLGLMHPEYGTGVVSFKGNKLTAKELTEKLPTHFLDSPKWNSWLSDNSWTGSNPIPPSSSEPQKPNPPSSSEPQKPNPPSSSEPQKPNPPSSSGGNSGGSSTGGSSNPTVPDLSIPSDKVDSSDVVDNIKDTISPTVDIKLNANSDETTTADKEVFVAAARYGKNVRYDAVDDNGDTVYQWEFNTKNIKDATIDVKLGIKFETEKRDEIQKLTGQQNAFYVSFEHHGKLPGTAEIKVKVDSTFNDGDPVFLYYYNEETGKIELKASSITVQNGYAVFNIDHCSVYFLTKEAVTFTPSLSGSPQTGDSNPLPFTIVFTAIIMLVGYVYFFSGKKAKFYR